MAVNGASILVVDDTKTNQMLLEALLAKEGFRVIVAGSGQQAIEEVKVRTPDLILLDVMMPEMDGFETCNHLKSLPQIRDVPIIFITALDDRKNKIQGLQIGAVDYITKPFARDEVLARIDVHLNLRKARLQLLQEEKMASLGQLVAGLAHEINNPVSFIHGNLQHINRYTLDLLTLVETYDEAMPDAPMTVSQCKEEIDLEFLQADLPQLMDSMTAGTRRIAEIVRSLRLFARLEEADCKAVNLQDGLESSLLFLQHRLQPKGNSLAIDIQRQYDPKLPEVVCYAGAINQALMNLLVNAIDAIEDQIQELADPQYQPSLTLSTQQGADPSLVEVRIADNGIGMTPAVQARVFEQFYTTKIIGRGAGLGLSVAQQIVEEQHGGKLSFTSVPGEGSEFCIALPLMQPDY